jgi:hypothetical protein
VTSESNIHSGASVLLQLADECAKRVCPCFGFRTADLDLFL